MPERVQQRQLHALRTHESRPVDRCGGTVGGAELTVVRVYCSSVTYTDHENQGTSGLSVTRPMIVF
jgi:hypothetical protein